jgi:acyl-CoA synthetase (AMP-forming)/AMP-acid ligase II
MEGIVSNELPLEGSTHLIKSRNPKAPAVKPRGRGGCPVVAASRGGADPVPVAFVRPTDGVELDEVALRARCLQRLARFKVPKRIVVVEAFPIVDSPNGPKVQRIRLREMAEVIGPPLNYT